MNHSFQTLEFNHILEELESYAFTEKAKTTIRQLEPYLSKSEVEHAQKETTEARAIIDKFGEPSMVSMQNVTELLIRAEQGACLSAEQLEYLGITFTAVKRMKNFLNRSKMLEISLPYYETELDSLEELRLELSEKIRGGKVDDYASKLLRELRRSVERLDDKMRFKMESILKNNKAYLSDSFVTMRNGRLCVPVKKEYKFQIAGSVIDKSSTGMTVFIEPTAVAKMGEELQIIKIDADNEERRILYELTNLVAKEREVIEHNQKILEKIDFLFAKGKLSLQYEGKQPQINSQHYISIKKGRHPLMPKETCIPLNFEIGKEATGIIITGPNTGGKTVAIKTVGLHSLMAQSGLHVPCEEGDFCMNNQVLCDIGDGQNIAESLSTFSAHIVNTLEILKKANQDTLVIMDELGSGTDPTEGMGIAIAILKELQKSKALFLVTTHYPEVKKFALQTDNVMNAKMEFDRITLKPTYQLHIGKAGESCALYIAKQLGMSNSMLQAASTAAYGKVIDEFKELPIDDQQVCESVPLIKKEKNLTKQQSEAKKYRLGDSVIVLPDKKTGIVCKESNNKGLLQVQVPNEKIWVNHKRIVLQVAATELYPDDYDFSIIFDSVEDRKARHQMGKKHRPDIEVTTE